VATVNFSNGLVTIRGTGTSVMTASNSASTNYQAASTNQTLTVNKALLMVTASNVIRSYGQTNPSLPFSVTGFVYGETTNVLSVQPSTSTTATTNSVPGTYPITVSGGTATNYSFTNIPGTLTVTAAVIASNGITLTPPASLVYDGSAKSYTASAPGVSGFRITYVGRNTTSYVQTTTAPSNAGEYTVTATDTDPNYDGSKSLDFAISKASQTITLETIGPRYLGFPAFSLVAQSSSGLPVSFESSNPGVISVSGTSASLVALGTSVITARQIGNENYLAASPVTETVTVSTPLPEIEVALSETRGGVETLTWLASGDSQNLSGVAYNRTRTFDYTIRNTGQIPLTGLGLSMGGSNPADFPVLFWSGQTNLEPGQRANFSVRIAPTSPGSKSGTLAISSNDGDENPFLIRFTGSGTGSFPPAITSSGPISGQVGATLSFHVVATESPTSYGDRKSTRLNSSHIDRIIRSRMPSSA
jgi:hypothetical protein